MKKISLSRVPMFLFMVLVSVVSIAPFYFMMMMGTYKSSEIYQGVKLVPGYFLQVNFHSLMQIDFLRYYGNSLFVAFSSAILTVLVCAACGYGLSKYSFKGRKSLINVIMLTMMVPTQLSLVGFTIEMHKIGWLNTHLPLIIPAAASAFGVFWINQFTASAIPNSVLESARIDGCGEFRTFMQIALPFMRPACMTLALLSFLWSWNSFMMPMIVLTSESVYTLPLGIRQLATQFRTDLGAQILGLTLATIPMLLMFAAFSKNLISGLAAAAVKE